MIRNLQNLKLYRVVPNAPTTPAHSYKTVISKLDTEGVIQMILNRAYIYLNGYTINDYTIQLVEELEPTTTNMVGLCYFIYLKNRDSEQRYPDSRPFLFETVLAYGDQGMIDYKWDTFSHLDANEINFSNIVNEARDRDRIKELAKLDLEKRISQHKKEELRLKDLEKILQNIDIIPLVD